MGTDKNLIIDDGYRWTNFVSKDSWHLSGESKLESNRCLDTLLRLNSVQLDLNPPEKFITMMKYVISGSLDGVPWSHVMSDKDHRAFIKNLINQANDALEHISKDYYMNTWVPQSTVLRALQPACVDVARYNELLNSVTTNITTLQSFKPDKIGYANPVDYDRFGTVTGRLTVQSGPQILTLKRDYRDVIKSSYDDGKIVYIDFAALEARILLYEAGMRCDHVDMYSYISQELFGGSTPRDAIKSAVISELYGSGKHLLGEQLGIEGHELDEFVGKVKRFFKTNELKKRIKDDFIKTGYVTNRYGRKVVPSAPLDHILVNSYAQSTGVDVSLLGFSSIVEKLKSFADVRSLFVLHDALIIDVPGKNIQDVLNIEKVTVPGYVQSFYLKSHILT
jgi:hypothetical protein